MALGAVLLASWRRVGEVEGSLRPREGSQATHGGRDLGVAKRAEGGGAVGGWWW
jgi:hypothetical protein